MLYLVLVASGLGSGLVTAGLAVWRLRVLPRGFGDQTPDRLGTLPEPVERALARRPDLDREETAVPKYRPRRRLEVLTLQRHRG
jgi:hypothetical protein